MTERGQVWRKCWTIGDFKIDFIEFLYTEQVHCLAKTTSESFPRCVSIILVFLTKDSNHLHLLSHKAISFAFDF
jgi:hypothetical protein